MWSYSYAPSYETLTMSENLESQPQPPEARPAVVPKRVQNPAVAPIIPPIEYPSDLNYTPIVFGMAPHHHWSMKHVELNTLRRNVVNETQGHYIVSMDPDDFLHEFLPWNNFKTRVFRAFKAQKPSAERINHLIAMGAKTERQMYGCFVSILAFLYDALLKFSLEQCSLRLARRAWCQVSQYQLP